jgi:hypothetical protein
LRQRQPVYFIDLLPITPLRRAPLFSPLIAIDIDAIIIITPAEATLR